MLYAKELQYLEEKNRLEKKPCTYAYGHNDMLEILDDKCRIIDKGSGEHQMFKYQRTEGRVFYRIGRQVVNIWAPYLLFKSDSILSSKIEKTLWRITETGIMDRVDQIHFPTPLKTIEEEPLKPLSLDSFVFGFIIWLIGLTLASISFI